jgi:hypothetical protein
MVRVLDVHVLDRSAYHARIWRGIQRASARISRNRREEGRCAFARAKVSFFVLTRILLLLFAMMKKCVAQRRKPGKTNRWSGWMRGENVSSRGAWFFTRYSRARAANGRSRRGFARARFFVHFSLLPSLLGLVSFPRDFVSQRVN